MKAFKSSPLPGGMLITGERKMVNEETMAKLHEMVEKVFFSRN